VVLAVVPPPLRWREVELPENGKYMEQVTSKDGTLIAYERTGSGPPLVLVHGTGIDHTYWTPVVGALNRSFTVWALDRRGRGLSGNAEPYSLEREFEDVAVIVDSAAEPAFLVGHSYGALCALEASLLTQRVRKLVFYEPPIYTTIDIPYPKDALTRFNAFLSSGDMEGALEYVYEIFDAPREDLDIQRSLPNWPARLQATPTLPREFLAARNYKFVESHFAAMTTPVLLLVGERTTPFYKAAVKMLDETLPDTRLSVLPGQGHEAVIAAPELFLQAVGDFLT